MPKNPYSYEPLSIPKAPNWYYGSEPTSVEEFTQARQQEELRDFEIAKQEAQERTRQEIQDMYGKAQQEGRELTYDDVAPKIMQSALKAGDLDTYVKMDTIYQNQAYKQEQQEARIMAQAMRMAQAGDPAAAQAFLESKGLNDVYANFDFGRAASKIRSAQGVGTIRIDADGNYEVVVPSKTKEKTTTLMNPLNNSIVKVEKDSEKEMQYLMSGYITSDSLNDPAAIAMAKKRAQATAPMESNLPLEKPSSTGVGLSVYRDLLDQTPQTVSNTPRSKVLVLKRRE